MENILKFDQDLSVLFDQFMDYLQYMSDVNSKYHNLCQDASAMCSQTCHDFLNLKIMVGCGRQMQNWHHLEEAGSIRFMFLLEKSSWEEFC